MRNRLKKAWYRIKGIIRNLMGLEVERTIDRMIVIKEKNGEKETIQ